MCRAALLVLYRWDRTSQRTRKDSLFLSGSGGFQVLSTSLDRIGTYFPSLSLGGRACSRIRIQEIGTDLLISLLVDTDGPCGSLILEYKPWCSAVGHGILCMGELGAVGNKQGSEVIGSILVYDRPGRW